jgi:DNA-binding CsgD family transcriptional regulator
MSFASAASGSSGEGRDDLGQLCAALYGAALEPRRWPEALCTVGRFIGGPDECLVIVTFSDGPQSSDGWSLAGIPGSAERHHHIERGRHPLFSADRESQGGEHLASTLAELSLTREFALRHGSLCGVSRVLQPSDDVFGTLHVLRRDVPIGSGFRERVEIAQTHVGRALEIYSRLRRAKRLAAIDRSVLDLVDVAAMVVTFDGRLVRANAAAHALLAQRESVGVEDGVLRCIHARGDGALAEALRAVEGPDAMGRFSALLLPRLTGVRPHLALVTRLSEELTDLPMATVLIRNVSADHPNSDRIFGDLFGLTPCELRVAVGIVRGSSPQQIAERLGLSVETVRSHLKRVFFKSATCSQADLVRLVLGECPVA